jgi:hypothetical protein
MTVLPWQPGTTPLMLAPMQGLTNRDPKVHSELPSRDKQDKCVNEDIFCHKSAENIF